MKPREIRALRRRLGLSQQAFAERLGVSIQSVHCWETGKRKPSRLALKVLDRLVGEGSNPPV